MSNCNNHLPLHLNPTHCAVLTNVVPASCIQLMCGLGTQVEEDRQNLPSFLPFRSCRYRYCSCITEKGDYQAMGWVQGCGYTAVYSRINPGNCQMKAVPHFFVSALSFCLLPYAKSSIHWTVRKPSEQTGSRSKPSTSPLQTLARQLFDSSYCTATQALILAQGRGRMKQSDQARDKSIPSQQQSNLKLNQSGNIITAYNTTRYGILTPFCLWNSEFGALEAQHWNHWFQRKTK